MAPKRGFYFYPIFLILSLSALFIFSLYRSSSLSLSSSPPIPQFPLTITNFNNIPNPNLQFSPNFSFTIKVLTYDRLHSLSRCLRSLSAAHYDNDKVNIHIFIDHFKILDQKDQDNEYLDKKLNESREILDFVDGFEWRFGEKMVHYRTGNVGLQAQWLEAWWPVSDDEFAFVVEDDIELSPLYYRFLKSLIVGYYYNASNYSPWIYGASLQRPRFVPGKHGNKINIDKETKVFLYQLVGTWGQLLFPKPWKEFRLWYDTHKTKGMKPILDGMVTTGWYRKMGDRIWTPWFIKFIHARGYFNIYTNFLNESALSVSHRDTGVNYGKTAGPDSNLIQESSRESNVFKLEPLRNLKRYDFCFREVIPDRIVTNVDELEPVLKSVQKANALVVVSVDQTSKMLTRNLLCLFTRLNVWNYIFVGPDSDFLLDLARRGHTVVNVDAFFDTLKEYKSSKLSKENIVKALVVKKALEMKYDTWVLDHDMVPVNADFFLDSVKRNPTVDFYVGSRLGLLFARSLGSGIWNNRFVNEIAQTADPTMSKDGGGFGFIAGKLLERKGVKLERFDEGLGFSVEINAGDDNGIVLKNDTKVVFWSSDAGSGLVQNRLESLGLWIIDSESHCKAVICHPS
ncbi:putative nucleotide-diphospho-sugar transferase [Helianthus annuus]|nr:putative nucleotide-diphospho-sugar transferase [Helianthus annuus]KAJ0937880.1 putative nucleotide-diphospho-sugar transferase [Helianthus annuus]